MVNWLEKAFNGLIDDVMARPRSHVGSRFKNKRQLVDNHGVMELQTVGKQNLYEEIQSHKDSVDINKMLERYRSGDVTALDRVKAHYLDLEGAPRTLAEMYSFVKNTTAFFDTLPLEVRKRYDFNPSNFVADIGSDEFKKMFTIKTEDLEKITPVKEVNIESPVVEKEVKE